MTGTLECLEEPSGVQRQWWTLLTKCFPLQNPMNKLRVALLSGKVDI